MTEQVFVTCIVLGFPAGGLMALGLFGLSLTRPRLAKWLTIVLVLGLSMVIVFGLTF